MAAPLGFKTFNSGDVLTAADTNGYLMQGVWTFANAAARTAAVTSPQEGNVSFLKDTNSLEIYDGAAWVAYGSGDITGVTAGTGITGGGTSGTVTITNDMATKIDAKGDLIIGTGADTYDRLAVGTNGHVLTADSTTTTGTKWASIPSSGGFTLLSTNTLSSTVTQIGSISGSYKHLFIWILNWKAGGGTALQFQFGANGTYSTHNFYSLIRTNANATNANNAGGSIDLVTNASGTGDGADVSAWIYNYTDTTTRKTIAWNGAFTNNSAIQGCFFGAGASGQTTGALSTICLGAGSGTQSGTAYIYGVN